MLCLQPRTLPTQICHSFDLEIEPQPTKIYPREDYFGNMQHYFSVHESHKILKVVATSDVEVLPKILPPISTITCAEAREKFKFKIIPKYAVVSARKYETNSWWQVQRANAKLFSMFNKGAEPQEMAATYRQMLDYRQGN